MVAPLSCAVQENVKDTFLILKHIKPMGLLDVFFQSLSVEAANVSQAPSEPSSSIGPIFEDTAPKQGCKFVAIDLSNFE
jgi:hypothetical protein